MEVNCVEHSASDNFVRNVNREEKKAHYNYRR